MLSPSGRRSQHPHMGTAPSGSSAFPRIPQPKAAFWRPWFSACSSSTLRTAPIRAEVDLVDARAGDSDQLGDLTLRHAVVAEAAKRLVALLPLQLGPVEQVLHVAVLAHHLHL